MYHQVLRQNDAAAVGIGVAVYAVRKLEAR